MKSQAKLFGKYLLGAVIVAACVYWSLSNVDISSLWTILKNAHYGWFLLCLPVVVFSHWLRATRWKTMLEQTVSTSRLNAFSAVMIGYAVNNFTLKGGEILRPLVLSRRENIPFPTVMGTVVLERLLFDFAAMMIIFSWAVLALPAQLSIAYPEFTFSTLVPVLVLPFALLTLYLVVSGFYPQSVDAVLKKTIGKFSTPLYNKLHEINVAFERGFAIVRTPSQIARILGESAGIWLCYILPSYLIFFALDFPSNISFDFADATLMFAIGTLAYISPAPGALGVYHTLVATAMTRLYDVPFEQSLAYATLTHGTNLSITALGTLFLLREGKYIRLKRNTSEAQPLVSQQ